MGISFVKLAAGIDNICVALRDDEITNQSTSKWRVERGKRSVVRVYPCVTCPRVPHKLFCIVFNSRRKSAHHFAMCSTYRPGTNCSKGCRPADSKHCHHTALMSLFRSAGDGHQKRSAAFPSSTPNLNRVNHVSCEAKPLFRSILRLSAQDALTTVSNGPSCR